MSIQSSIDPLSLGILGRVHIAAQALQLPYLVIGASARMLLLENVYGLPEGRRTRDLDFAIQVAGWEDFERMREALLNDTDFAALPTQAHRLRYQDTMVLDIIPFGSNIEQADGSIEWPNEGVVMNVLPLEDLLSTAIPVEIDAHLTVPVISPEGLLVAKLFAWHDRHLRSPGRDAADMAYLLRHLTELVGIDNLFEHYLDVLEQQDFNLEIAAARVFGHRAVAPLSKRTATALSQVLDSSLSEGVDARLIAELERFGGMLNPAHTWSLLSALRDGGNI